MHPVPIDSVLSALRWRYATKAFDPQRKVAAETWSALEESLLLTPSSFGLQPWKFIVVETPSLREELRAHSWNQAQITEASHLCVFAARTDLTTEDIDAWMARMAEVRALDVAVLDPFKQVIEGFAAGMESAGRHAWNTRQVYIGLGQFMTAAALLGIDTCPLEGINTAAYDKVLGLENSGYATAVACAVGYRADGDAYATMPKVRFDAQRVIRHV